MPKKKLAKKPTKANSTERNIQYVALGIILLVAVFFARTYFPKKASQPSVPTAVNAEPTTASAAESAPEQNAAVCQRFADIPAAKQYASAPPLKTDSSAKYFATFNMENGSQFKAQLFPDKAPITVNSFIFLSCKGFFDGVTFHRVLEDFMAQGGDPTGTGMGGPGYEFVNEDSDLTFDKAGVLAMANAGRDTNGSQFFITFAPADFLNGGYTIFGQIVEGMDAVNQITRRDPQSQPNFEGDKILSITISGE
ncbi:MAG: peptidylprolyl isomerase [Anaerolineales bacterium]|nr:peptidylprolyl isomerase [Anaerolineales bacterium]